MDLELMFSSTISPHMANWEKWTKFSEDLLVLVLAFTISIFTITSFTLFHCSERNTFTFPSLCMHQVLMGKIFCFQLRHHTCLIKVTLLQLHHHTSLTTFMLVTRAPLTLITHAPPTFITHNPLTSITHAPLMFITRAHCIHDTCSKLSLFHSNIPFHSPVFVHLQIWPVSQLTYLSPIFSPLTHKSDLFPISKHTWNTLTVLLLSNNIKINPRPWPTDQSPVFCSICSDKINSGIQKDTAPTCSIENCNARFHQACNGLSIHQTHHAKHSGCSITWKCPQHGTGVAEIIAPPPPVYEIPSRLSAVGKSCSVCKNPIRARYPDLAYHWANPSCNVCHLVATCSGFVNPRVPARACALSTQVWHCHLHSSLPASSHPATQPDT